MEKCVYSKELKERAVRLNHQRESIKELADELALTFSDCTSGVNGLIRMQVQTTKVKATSSGGG